MKKQITLKRLLLVAVLGFALLFIGSCKKELLTGNSPNSFEPIPSTKLTALKQWYSRNEGLITNEFNWLNSLSPKWDSVRVQNNEKGSIYEAVLHNPDKIFATDGTVNLKDSRKKYAPKSSIRLLIFRDELGQSYRSCFMEVIATGESELPQQLSYKNYGSLTGLVSFYELDGKLANSWVYSNGKAVMSTSANSALKVGSSARSKSGANGRIMFDDGPPEGYIDCGNRLVAHTRTVCGEVGGLESPDFDGGEGSGKICYDQMYFVSERIYCQISGNGSGNGEYDPLNPTTPGAGGDGDQPIATGENRFKIKLSDQQKYPRFTEMVKDLSSFVKNDAKVMDALKKWSGFSEAKILEKVKFGQGPEIVIKDIGDRYGYFNASQDPDVISVNINWVKGLEQSNLLGTRQATGFLLAVTVLHEFVHQAREANGLDTDRYEYGLGFENSAFGIIIERDNAGKYSYRFYGR